MNRFAFIVLSFLVFDVSVSAESPIEGWVRLDSGEPVANAQVRIFDMTDLGRGVIARTTTDGTGHFALPLRALSTDTGTALPTDFALGQNYPNPFNPSTIIPYQLPTAGRVRLEVFNILGQHLTTLVDAERAAGFYTAQWDGTDKLGRAMGAGVYIYRLRSGSMTESRRMVLVDGQAGVPAAQGSVRAAVERTVDADSPVYGLTVTGEGMVTYVDAAFEVRAGMAPVEVVVEAVEGLPRGKALTGGILGDVNGDGQVTLDDALLVTTYVVDGAVELPPHGDISLGDVNGDGQITLADALLLTTYVANPADPSLPEGIGQAVTSSGGDLVAGAIRRLTTYGGFFPTWSPDGRQIAFVSYRDGNSGIYVMDSDGSNQRRLTDHAASDWSPPAWSPDGQHIAFLSDRDGNVAEIYVMDSDGSNLRRLTDHAVWDASLSWSPDGRQIAFMSDRDGDFEIYVMGLDGSNLRRLTNHEGRDGFPSWSPDGRQIAFMSDRDGDFEIYVMGSDGSNLRRLTTNEATDWYPSWSPDGRQIAFSSDRDGNENIYVMELREAGGDGTPFDHGDSPETATSLAAGESIEGELLTGDIDYFRVSVSNVGWLVASTTGNTDTYGYIEDGSGNVLHRDDDGGEGSNFLVSAVVEPGTYYIRVRGDRASSTGAYTLELYLDDDRSPSAATSVVVGESIEGELLTGDIDYFRVSVSNVGWLVASTTGNTDTYGYVQDSLGQVLSENDDGGAGDNFRVSVAVEPGTYFIRVRGYDASSTGAYTLHLGDGDSPSTAISLVVGESIEGELSAGAIDYFRVSVATAGRLMAWTTGNTATYGYVQDSLGQVLSENDDGGADDNFFMSAAVLPGTYYIRVLGSDASSTGAYTLSLTIQTEQGSDGIRRLTYNDAGDYSPAWSPDGWQIAFVSRRDGDSEIYVVALDGSNFRRLTYNDAGDYSPAWSPDGRQIAFVSYRDGDSGIYVMDSDGSNQRRLTDHWASDWSPPAWSPDGRQIAFASGHGGNWAQDIYVMASDGSNLRRLTYNGLVFTTLIGGLPFDSAEASSPFWSPDGRHIAFASGHGDRDIYVVALDGSDSNLHNLPHDLAHDSAHDISPAWSPDGRHIAFVSYRDGDSEIYVVALDGSDFRRLTYNSAYDISPAWSPDGRQIAFVSRRDGDSGIYVMDSDGSNQRRLTTAEAFSPSWSRDGRDLAFASWSPDGRQIAFVSNRDGNSDIYVIELREEGGGATPPDHGDSPETATSLAVGESIEGELSASDSDYFRVTVSSPGTLMASTTGSTDTYGSVEDGSGNVLHRDDDGGEGRNFRVSVAVEPGTYYIQVRGFSDSTTGAYTLTIQIEEGSDSSG